MAAKAEVYSTQNFSNPWNHAADCWYRKVHVRQWNKFDNLHSQLFDQTFQLHSGCTLNANETFDQDLFVDFPETPAWTLAESDNKISWHAKVRIDIPSFPDWKRTVELQVVPAEFLDNVQETRPSDPTPPSATIPMQNTDDVPAALAVEEPSFQDNFAPKEPVKDHGAPVSPIAGDMSPLLNLIDEISNANRFGNERTEIVSAAEGHTYDIKVVVDRISSTFGFTGPDRYEKGRTVIGAVLDSDQTVQIFCDETTNDRIDDVSRGEALRVTAKVASWDSLYNRLVMHEV